MTNEQAKEANQRAYFLAKAVRHGDRVEFNRLVTESGAAPTDDFWASARAMFPKVMRSG